MSLQARPLRLSTTQADFEQRFQERLHWSGETDAAIEQRVAEILADVRQRGDAAVLEYTARFDGVSADSVAALSVTPMSTLLRPAASPSRATKRPLSPVR